MSKMFANRNSNHARWDWEESNVEITNVYHTDSMMETSLNRDSRHTHPNQEECYNVENDVYHIDSMTETS